MSLYAYDEGLLKYLKEALSFDNIINSAESSAFSNIVEEGEERKDLKVEVPMISFWRTANPLAIDGGGPFGLRHRGRVVGGDSEVVRRWRALPINISYQITIWSDRRREVDDIFRELIMYLTTDNPMIEVKFEGRDEAEKFVIEVVDTDDGTDIDSFGDRGRLYTTHILIDVKEAQLVFDNYSPRSKDIKVRTLTYDSYDNDKLDPKGSVGNN